MTMAQTWTVIHADLETLAKGLFGKINWLQKVMFEDTGQILLNREIHRWWKRKNCKLAVLGVNRVVIVFLENLYLPPEI